MSETRKHEPFWPYLLVGTVLGVVFTKAEVISWFRIQEMFRFQGFHMYGVIGSAVVVGALSLALLRRFGVKTRQGVPIAPQRQTWAGAGTRFWLGGFVFGLGWALCGACPGPIFTLIGNGLTVYLLSFLAALGGTWVYGAVRDSVPH